MCRKTCCWHKLVYRLINTVTLSLILIMTCCFTFNYFIWRHYVVAFVWIFMDMVMLAWVRCSNKIKKVRCTVKNGVNEATTLKTKRVVCITFLQYARYSIKWFDIVVVVSFRFFRMLPKKLLMKLPKKSDKGVAYLGCCIFYQLFLLINLHKCINSKLHPQLTTAHIKYPWYCIARIRRQWCILNLFLKNYLTAKNCLREGSATGINDFLYFLKWFPTYNLK